MRRQFNREFRKLGFEPVKGKEWRDPKCFAHIYTNGETTIGIVAVGKWGWVSKKRQDKMPITNRIMFSLEYTFPGDIKDMVGHMVANAGKTNV